MSLSQVKGGCGCNADSLTARQPPAERALCASGTAQQPCSAEQQGLARHVGTLGGGGMAATEPCAPTGTAVAHQQQRALDSPAWGQLS